MNPQPTSGDRSADSAEIVRLLTEIRDIQSERLRLQRQALDDQAQAKLVVDQSLALQRRAGKIQRVAIAALLVFMVLWLWLIWR